MAKIEPPEHFGKPVPGWNFEKGRLEVFVMGEADVVEWDNVLNKPLMDYMPDCDAEDVEGVVEYLNNLVAELKRVGLMKNTP